MMTRYTSLCAICIGTFALGCQRSPSNHMSQPNAVTSVPKASPEADKSNDSPASVVATYLIPQLNMPLAKQIAAALGAFPGVSKTTPILDKKHFEVEITSSQSTPEKILAAIQKITPQAQFKDVKHATNSAPSQHRCGGCPFKNSCAHKNDHL